MYEAARGSGARDVIIATDDKRIQAAAGKFGAHAVLTSTRHRSGTDRIAEAANACGLKDDEIIVNVQGDEYGLPARLINQVATALHNNSGKAIATLSEPLVDETRIIDSNVVKVVVDHDNNALYFSRSIIPWMKHAGDGRIYRRHVGLYAYTARTLQAFTRLAASALEKANPWNNCAPCIMAGRYTLKWPPRIPASISTPKRIWTGSSHPTPAEWRVRMTPKHGRWFDGVNVPGKLFCPC